MSYEPTIWQTGDIVTAEKLNKIEGGIAEASGGGALSIKAIPFIPTSNGGFVKEYHPVNPTFYTYEELRSIISSAGANVYAYNIYDAGSRGLSKFIVHSTSIEASSVMFDTPAAEDTMMYATTYIVSIDNTNVFTVEKHDWHFNITNDD